jgi:hypothetical protein
VQGFGVRLFQSMSALLSRKPGTTKIDARFLLSLALSTAAGFGQKITVGPNVQVSKAHPDLPHYEQRVAADPKDPNRLVGGSMTLVPDMNGYNGDGGYRVITYSTFDGGMTWEPTLESGDRGADPNYAFGADGKAYSAYIDDAPLSGGPAHFDLQRSTDGGKTWQPGAPLPGIDRPYMTVDNTEGKYDGRLYAHGSLHNWTTAFDGTSATASNKTMLLGLYLYHSKDGGKTWEPPVSRISASFDRFIQFKGNSVVLSDGTLAILFGERRLSFNYSARPTEVNAWLNVITSEDGGESLSRTVLVSDWYLYNGLATNGQFKTLAVDASNGSFRDRLYVVWPDCRSGRNQILLAYSSDKGKTWSKPVLVSDDLPPVAGKEGPDDFMPNVAVNSAGVVGVMWYDRRDNPDDLGYWTRFAASLDGGETFLPSVRASEAPNDPNRGTPFLFSLRAYGTRSGHEGSLPIRLTLNAFTFTGGDTASMEAGADGVFHPFWSDNRTGVPQLWTARITVTGKALRNGAADLQDLDDISDRVVLDFGNPRFDRATNTLSTDAFLMNTSKAPLSGPIKVRVLSMRSSLGIPEILNADNGEKLKGAVWDFSALLDGNQLKPGEESKAKRLEFHLSQAKPLMRSIDLIDIDARVLGKANVVSSPK